MKTPLSPVSLHKTPSSSRSAAAQLSAPKHAISSSIHKALCSIHLDVQLATTLARCVGTEGTRPVLADQANLAARYQRRLPLYRTAHVSIPVDTLTPAQVTDAILKAAGL